jgi:hypothetical protein
MSALEQEEYGGMKLPTDNFNAIFLTLGAEPDAS